MQPAYTSDPWDWLTEWLYSSWHYELNQCTCLHATMCSLTLGLGWSITGVPITAKWSVIISWFFSINLLMACSLCLLQSGEISLRSFAICCSFAIFCQTCTSWQIKEEDNWISTKHVDLPWRYKFVHDLVSEIDFRWCVVGRVGFKKI